MTDRGPGHKPPKAKPPTVRPAQEPIKVKMPPGPMSPSRVLLLSCGCWVWEGQAAQRKNHDRYHPFAYVMHLVEV